MTAGKGGNRVVGLAPGVGGWRIVPLLEGGHLKVNERGSGGIWVGGIRCGCQTLGERHQRRQQQQACGLPKQKKQ